MHYRQHGLRHVPYRVSRARRNQRAKSGWTRPDHEDPRMRHLGPIIQDEYATIRPNYETPKSPIILAHGLLGFEELRLPPKHLLPGIRYWRGIREALTARGIAVFTTSVPASASIEQRAARLAEDIAKKAGRRSVNIIAHSMGGLDSRHMISCLRPTDFKVLSLTTIATPHRGSAFADHVFEFIGGRLPRIYKALESLQMESGAFGQMTRRYMEEEFNPKTPDLDEVRYFSYGASAEPSLWSVFRRSHQIIDREEGANDGLVSVGSSKWGTYKGTLVGVSHLDLINWTNRLRWFIWEMAGNKREFNAIAFYLDIADMLAKEGL